MKERWAYSLRPVAYGERRYEEVASLEDALAVIEALEMQEVEIEGPQGLWNGTLRELFDARVHRFNGTTWEGVEDHD